MKIEDFMEYLKENSRDMSKEELKSYNESLNKIFKPTGKQFFIDDKGNNNIENIEIADKIEKFFNLRKEIYEYFKCDIDYYYLDDNTKYYWKKVKYNGCLNAIVFGEKVSVEEEDGNQFECEINNIFFEKAYTLIIAEIENGNKIAQIFDNKKRLC